MSLKTSCCRNPGEKRIPAVSKQLIFEAEAVPICRLSATKKRRPTFARLRHLSESFKNDSGEEYDAGNGELCPVLSCTQLFILVSVPASDPLPGFQHS